MNPPTLQQRYERLCATYIEHFCAKHDLDTVPDIPLDAIRHDIDNNTPKGLIWKWMEERREVPFKDFLKNLEPARF